MKRKPSLRVLILGAVCVFAGIYLIAAYLVFPRTAEHKALLHPDLLDGARLTHTGNDLPGDPLNISLVGTEEHVVRSLVLAGWRPADALSFRSSVRIVVDTVLSEPDPNAPVSNLFLYGRREDLAFEKPIGHSPRERNHVRFWKSAQEEAGRPIWMGAATHDVGVELSRTTEQVTHRIAPDVDSERDLLLSDLKAANCLVEVRWVPSFHKELNGRNGGGDPWHTDGRLAVAVLSNAFTPTRTTNPP